MKASLFFLFSLYEMEENSREKSYGSRKYTIYKVYESRIFFETLSLITIANSNISLHLAMHHPWFEKRCVTLLWRSIKASL